MDGVMISANTAPTTISQPMCFQKASTARGPAATATYSDGTATITSSRKASFKWTPSASRQ